ncbi:putative tRNA-splicing endonuclease subunit tsp-1 [Paecilomyces lecythidis]|uniref:tRNA-splicing endonuclease subunit tsp-1 n=1 Tax=Paecilomyces lecythidis TaxID=3004212 RepID=A0ABR3XIW6_9EURO
MQLTRFLLTAVFASSAVLAAPAPAPGKSMMAADSQWTITSLKRICNEPNTSCTWTFGIDTGSGNPTACTYVVDATNASEANGGPSDCGDFTITSGWSGQFGPGNGFTTLSVVDNPLRQIIWPAYTDKQLAGGNVVTPDQSYTPAALP